MTSRHRSAAPARTDRSANRPRGGRVRTAGAVVGLGAFLGGAGAGAWASPDTGPGAAVLGAWDAVTGTSRIAADSGATDGPDLVGAAVGGGWFANRPGTGSASRSLDGGGGTVQDWADGTNEVIDASVAGPGVSPQVGAAALPALVDGLLVTDVSAGLLSLAVPTSASS